MEGELQRTVGENLRRYRQQRGLSQESFAEALHVHRTSWAAWNAVKETSRCKLLSGSPRLSALPLSTCSTSRQNHSDMTGHNLVTNRAERNRL
ncbi:helix-turn-helix transcriptional regulator [Agrococcus casei]|uniref:helix-turn-helix transcriptional regulator n=1 Tax=Agrococcus casei TaxID=343512 RepID=UPI003F9162F1